MMNDKERVIFYLGALNNGNSIRKHFDKHLITIDDLNPAAVFGNVYDVKLKQLLKHTKHEKEKFVFQRADIIKSEKYHKYTLCKNRTENTDDGVLLRCMNADRHWARYKNKPADIPFNSKKNIVFWRGTTTGCSKHHEARKWSPREVNRFKLVEKWFDVNKSIDVGFSKIHRDWLREKYLKYTKGDCKISYFLEHKYILSVEGNDKDSGLQWKLNSNSVVLMPKPRVTTWLMETTLIPNFHYVLIKDDFSDLEEKLEWCNNNQNKCMKIIRNANNFMEQFKQLDREHRIEREVLDKYFEIMNKI